MDAIWLGEDSELIFLWVHAILDERSVGAANFIPELRRTDRKYVRTQDHRERVWGYCPGRVPENDGELGNKLKVTRAAGHKSDKRTLSSTSGSPIFLTFSMRAVIDLGRPKSTKA
jgi:hypothetical protein